MDEHNDRVDWSKRNMNYYVRIILLAGILTCFAVTSWASPISPKLPSTLNFQSLNEVSPPSTEADWSFEMSKLDMVICSSHISGLRSRNSDICLLKYMLLHYIIITDTEELNALQTYATANGYDVESAFLHYYDDTTATMNGQSVTIPGYGGGTATSLSQARVKNYIWTDYGWLCNPKSALFRKFTGNYYRLQLDTGDKPDGIFVDAVSPLRDYAPATTTGGHIIEYGNKTKTDAQAAYQSDIAASFAEVNAAMGSDGKFGDRFLLPNISYIQEDEIIGFSADGILTEFWIQPVQPYFPYAYDLASRLAAVGKILIFTQASSIPQVSSASNYSSAADRQQMFSLTNYWIAKQGKFTYYQQKAPNGYPLLSSFWCKAREFDLGAPVQPLYSTWKTGTDSIGQNYTIYKREYTKALMLNRPQIGWTYTDYSTPCQLYDLGGTYKLLHSDGTLGPEITKIGLAMGEAVTLLNTGTPAPPDTTPPIISSVSTSSITATSATVAWTTDEPTTGTVEYGTTTSYGSSAPASTSATSQSVSLAILTANTLYHYRVTAMDAAGNRSVGTDKTFTTTASSGGGASGSGFIKHWAILGSFGFTNGQGHNTDYIGESTVHPSVGDTTAGKIWTDFASTGDCLDLYPLFTTNTYAIAYLNVYVYSLAQRNCQVRIGIDDAAKVFLNGVMVDDYVGYRPPDPDTDKVNITLKSGWNQLLVKAENYTAGWTLYVRFTDTAGNNLTDLSYMVYSPTSIGSGTPKIGITIIADKPTAKIGDQLNYIVTYTNTGDAPATSAVVSADVNPHVTFVSATGGGTYDALKNVVMWNVGNVQPGASSSVKYTVVVK